MPRYFFHVNDGANYIDEVGTELTDLTEARAQAVIAAGEALKDYAAEFWNHGDWCMNVVDENGSPVCSLRFSAHQPG
jgi:Domain of unknown function (DUF6894)